MDSPTAADLKRAMLRPLDTCMTCLRQPVIQDGFTV
jgi:hypothetical protein